MEKHRITVDMELPNYPFSTQKTNPTTRAEDIRIEIEGILHKYMGRNDIDHWTMLMERK